MAIKLDQNNIYLCPLGSYSSKEEFLLALGYSKSWIKKFLSRKILEQSISKELFISSDLINKFSINPNYIGIDVDILHEDDHFIVLNKPSEVHGHPLHYEDKNNLLSFLRYKNKGKFLDINMDKQERGLLYRLDFETSGVLVYVKNQLLFNELFNNRENRIVAKNYLAVVQGETPEEATLINLITGSDKKGSVMKVVEEGQRAELRFEKIKYCPDKNLSLIKIYLKTGLRHQIRVQLSHFGFPLLGDVKYGGKRSTRIFLHAYEYMINLNSFEDLGGEINFQAPRPLEFDI